MIARRAAILAEVSAERQRQVFEFGHNEDADRDLSVAALPAKTLEFAIIARDCASIGSCHDLTRARRKLVQVAALAVAAIERIDGGAELMSERAAA